MWCPDLWLSSPGGFRSRRAAERHALTASPDKTDEQPNVPVFAANTVDSGLTRKAQVP